MITFYYHPSPNPLKVALMLEETGLAYELRKVDTFKGEQHESAFLAINPNAKVPVIVDGGTTVFDSNAILLYLSEKSGQFGGNAKERGAVLSWLMFVATGLSPFSGQAVHFLHMAPEQIPYARNRYLKETERHYRVMDAQLAKTRFLAGNDYSIADIAAWGWMNYAGYIFGEKGLTDFPHVKRMFDEVSARPAAVRAHEVKSKVAVKTEFDEETLRALFPQNYTATAA
jgi:GSH-dependent disulfide-bond oxidoreductase